jgi:hypothetical protein
MERHGVTITEPHHTVCQNCGILIGGAYQKFDHHLSTTLINRSCQKVVTHSFPSGNPLLLCQPCNDTLEHSYITTYKHHSPVIRFIFPDGATYLLREIQPPEYILANGIRGHRE